LSLCQHNDEAIRELPLRVPLLFAGIHEEYIFVISKDRGAAEVFLNLIREKCSGF